MRQQILSDHADKRTQAVCDYLDAVFDAVPQLLEALESARAFSNGFNGELIGIIREITDAAGADAVPFLDDAVRYIVAERNKARADASALEPFGCYAGVPMLLQRPLHFDNERWRKFKEHFWAVIAAGADAKVGRLPKDSAYGEMRSMAWEYDNKKRRVCTRCKGRKGPDGFTVCKERDRGPSGDGDTYDDVRCRRCKGTGEEPNG